MGGPGSGHEWCDLDELVTELSEPQSPHLENGLDEHPASRAILKVRCDRTSERVI